ncbi:MAG TPA: VWA domain-containing protein [Vicinamibacteria bacterium]|nr:VWA domain-containing protein [Vicinamibacteria bacterium]
MIRESAAGRAAPFLSLGVAAIAVSTAAPGALRDEPVFPSGVQLVTIDAVVLDHQGLPVRGLTRADFQLTENGELQAITHFEAVSVPPAAGLPTPQAEPAVFTASGNEGPPPAVARSFVIVYDDVHISPLRATAAREAVDGFLRREVRPGDRVAVVVVGSGAWWTAQIPEGREDLLAFLDGQSSGRSVLLAEGLTDAEAQRIAEYDEAMTRDLVVERWVRQGRCEDMCEYVQPCDPREGRRACADQVRAEALRRNEVAQHSVERTLATLAGAMAGLAPDRGRKSLVLVSEGFLHDPKVSAYRGVVQASLRANTAVYFLDVRGLQTTSEVNDVSRRGDYDDFLRVASEESQLAAAGAEQVAEDSGGFVIRHRNDLAAGLARVAREAEAFYLLGYEPSLRPGHAGFRKVTVRVARPGVEVRARKGYFVDGAGHVEEPLPTTARATTQTRAPTSAKPAVRREALGPSLAPRQDLRLRTAAYAGPPAAAGRAKVHVVAEIDLSSLGVAGEQTKVQVPLEIRLDVWPRNGKEWVAFDRQVKLEAHQAGEASVWHPVPFDMALPPGVYQARVRVRDTAGDREGTLTHRFEVPEPRGLRFATPVLTDLARREGGGAPTLVPTAARAFDTGRGRVLYVQFEVLGAPAGRGVTARVVLRDETGREVRAVPSAAVEPDAGGRLSRMLGFALDDLGPGRYELVLEAKDEKTAETCTHREALLLRAPQASRAPGNGPAERP